MLFCGFTTLCGLDPGGDYPLHPWLEFFIGSAVAWVALVHFAAKNRRQADRGFPVIVRKQKSETDSN